MAQIENILVIKLGALGDFIQALGPMAAVRRHHPGARITLLTTDSFIGFGRNCGYFDAVWVDKRPKLFDFRGWLDLRKALNSGGFSRVYDLQNNDRTALYFKLFRRGGRPEWVGAARGASHRNASPERVAGHAFDGHVQTLALAGVQGVEIDRLDWLSGDVSDFGLQAPYVLLVPGSAPSRPEKRWPAQHYAALARMLAARGVQPVILGTQTEQAIAAEICAQCPEALDLTGRTSFAQIAVLARGAAGAIGNDTGPMHLIAATDCPVCVLFSGASDPARHAPKGGYVCVLQKDDLADLTPEAVFAGLGLGNVPN